MARPKGAGRKPAKNEVAAGLINALNFCAVIKAPTTTSMPQHWHIWLNQGQAISFDGIVAAGHPIDADIAGYPHAKLLLDALENTDKSFTLVVRETGAFEVNSDKYQALVPALDHSQVIPTPPDMNQARFNDGAAFVRAMEAAGKVVSETGDVVLFSAVRLTGDGSVMATDGNTIVEAYHGNQTPPGIVLPKQFATALVKSGKVPVGMGMSPNWETFTVWFEDGAWLRTAIYPMDTWPGVVTDTFFQLIGVTNEPGETPAKLWSTVKALLPFTDDDNRIIFRPGLVRTHPDRRVGAALETADLALTLDIDGKRLVSVEPLAARYTVGAHDDQATFVFYGDKVRGVIAGLPTLPEVASEAPQGGWEPAGQGDGWAMAAPAGSPAGASVPQGWNGIPANGLGGDPEYESERQGVPVDQLVTVEEAFIFTDQDSGINVAGLVPAGDFVPSEWANGLKDVNE